MCLPSQQLKLCTCAGKLPTKENTWELYRFVGEKEEVILGTAIPPLPFTEDQIAIHEERVAAVLNAEQCFDKPLRLKEKDILILRLQIHDQEHEYAFTYTGKQWEKGADNFAFTLINEYRKKAKGLTVINFEAFQK
jgi:hypothetical protein